MTGTDTAICNQALYLLGADRIDTINEGSPNSIVCQQFYPQARDEVLSHYPWNCAVWRVQLQAISGDTYSAYAYRYQLPEDPYCLRVLNLIDKTGDVYTDLKNEPYEIERRTLLTNKSPCYIKYICRIEDETQLDTWVSEVLIFAMAAKISPKVAAKKAADMYQAYLLKRNEAMQTDGLNRKNRKKPEPTWDTYG